MLSDELVYAAMKETTLALRAQFKGVWDGNGLIRANRVPQDPAPRLDYHGLPTAPVWKRYYALVGLEAAARYGFKIASKADKRLKAEGSSFRVGLVVLGGLLAKDACPNPELTYNTRTIQSDPYPRTVVRQLNNHEGKYDEPWGSEKIGKMLDLGGRQHNHLVLFFHGVVRVGINSTL